MKYAQFVEDTADSKTQFCRHIQPLSQVTEVCSAAVPAQKWRVPPHPKPYPNNERMVLS